MIPEPEQHPACAEQHRIAVAVCTSRLPAPARLIMHTAAHNAAKAAEAGRPFAITLTELSEQTGLTHREVARRAADLLEAGWIARVGDSGYLPTVPAAAGRPA